MRSKTFTIVSMPTSEGDILTRTRTKQDTHAHTHTYIQKKYSPLTQTKQSYAKTRRLSARFSQSLKNM